MHYCMVKPHCSKFWLWQFYKCLNLSRLMTKPTKWLCAQRRLRSAWVSAQSDQSSPCAQWVAKDPSFLHADRTAKALNRLGGCPGCSESSLGAHAILLVLSWGGSFFILTGLTVFQYQTFRLSTYLCSYILLVSLQPWNYPNQSLSEMITYTWPLTKQPNHHQHWPHQANLVLIAYASSEGSGEPVHQHHHTSSESRGTFRQKATFLASLNGWACTVKPCHDRMLEDANSLDGAQMTIDKQPNHHQHSTFT